ncbi:MAG TPA: class I SAM-dependent DNA methyltransferase [Gaiellaceae bacterium]|nr:class I SAM-dependent DNA methyltransferase [Gaiellaceae bacterium]
MPVRTGRRGRPPILDLCPTCAADTKVTTAADGTEAPEPTTGTVDAATTPLSIHPPEVAPVLAAAAPPLEPMDVPLPAPVAGSRVIKNHAAFIWSVADLLRGDYKQSEYGKVILPLVVLRRLDCVLDPTKDAVLSRHEALKGSGIENLAPVLEAVAREQFYNVSKLDLPKLLDDPPNIADNLHAYIQGFSPGAREVLDRFDFAVQIDRLARAKLLYLVVSRFCEIDLHPEVVSNLEMGYLYEELVRRFSELSNETAGEHFTPREVIRLMVNLLFIEDDDALAKPGVVRTLYDPACGTGGMLSVAEDHLRGLNSHARLEVFGQELNAETYAICRSDMMLKGQDASHIHFGNSFTEDGEKHRTFDYMLANPPFGVEWKKVADPIKTEAETLGFGGRFGAGLPRINDGSFLFLQHMLSKMKPVEEGGSRLAIVFNGSPLFTGGAGSGESEIRRWIIENDWLEAVVALPDQLFYNTGISTYFWVLTNRKRPERRGKVQLLDAREFFVKMRKSLGEKRKEISPERIDEITRLYGAFEEDEKVKVFRNEQFGYQRITVERPLRVRYTVTDDTAAALSASKAFVKLAPQEQERLIDALSRVNGLSTTNPKEAVAGFESVLGKLPTATMNTILAALTIRDPNAPVVTKNGTLEADSDLRDNENVPLPTVPITYTADPTARLASADYRDGVEEYVEAEVLPYVPDAWVDHNKTKIGYEIPITRHFYRYMPPRPLAEIDAEIKKLEDEIQTLLDQVSR